MIGVKRVVKKNVANSAADIEVSVAIVICRTDDLRDVVFFRSAKELVSATKRNTGFHCELAKMLQNYEVNVVTSILP